MIALILQALGAFTITVAAWRINPAVSLAVGGISLILFGIAFEKPKDGR
ncbi:hypothetical protein UFOVP968_31 [uncultured Caudovirales phage]|uniref:Uncharacterized protein n=1 Tax=uncultured Caudovirales phage TaxID=2100421 RepID=A0A6J5PW02_9CAUD|nr:hypothetical protein UFOVP968_31 [uncultured Caudovirales phage]CAB4186195.1 hypothetical protein UFOVP1133_30 [uncultured Caudovirales phage]CAB4192489.1 hypothetical protein UFOVP1249_28 [uncultured Caudovirales phage]CAB4217004.1 hypothetical protein UFOVP1494_6 [uncultured Caudovirales phage]CAB5231141.1 hypothetical protein UFOVP1583_28 [uncultured Caudovirales phage]